MRRSVALAVCRMRVQDQRPPRLLREVEVLDEVAEDRRLLASVRAPVGSIHETAGNLPSLAALKKLEIVVTFCSSPSCCTVSKYGSGFQMPGVFAPCLTDSQTIASSSQSGSVPVKT